MPPLGFFADSVRKSFSSPEAFHRELNVYQLGLPHVPHLIGFSEPEWILIERVEGEPYLDSDNFPQRIYLIASAIAEFHLSTYKQGQCLCHWDNQPGNILLSKETCHLVDFSDSQNAPPEDDITHLFLFWASEMPSGRFSAFCGEFIRAYEELIPLNRTIWNEALKRSSTRFDARRKLHQKTPAHLDAATILENRGKLLIILP